MGRGVNNDEKGVEYELNKCGIDMNKDEIKRERVANPY